MSAPSSRPPTSDRGRLPGRLLTQVVRPIRWLVHLWRRSVQFRVVCGTLLWSSAVIIVVGWVLLQQVTDGLLDEKVRVSLREASAGIQTAQTTIDNSDPSDSLYELSTRLTQDLSQRGVYDIVIDVEPLGNDDVAPTTRTTQVSENSVPTDIRQAVSSEHLVYRYTTIRRAHSPTTPGLVVGAKLREPQGAAFNVYYLFDLTQQQQTLTLLDQSLFAVGVLIIVLLGFVAWFVTRQVVTPVRLARRIAERLAAGVLDERMEVRGEDDLARLATSFNQMATSLQRQIRQLEELSRVQRRFVSDVSHELRTPLTTVRMAADLLHESRVGFDAGAARAAELLQTELNRFEELLADLLEISRFDAGAADLALEDVDLRDLATKVAATNEPLAARKGSRLVLELPAEPALAEVDTRRIRRVVRNLVANAIEYGDGRDVVIRVASDDECAAISVRDHGIGLNPGESAMVFERFWRADPARARTTGGTGLGLAIAMEDVLLHGGWLQAWGEAGVGAQFRMTLPRHATGPLNHSPIPLVPPERQALALGAAANASSTEPPDRPTGVPTGATAASAASGATAPTGVPNGPTGATGATDRASGGVEDGSGRIERTSTGGGR